MIQNEKESCRGFRRSESSQQVKEAPEGCFCGLVEEYYVFGISTVFNYYFWVSRADL